jgi:hypothetical protein
MGKAQIVADVGVGEEDAVHRRAVHLPLRVRAEGVDRLDLGREVRRGVHQIDVAGLRIVDRQARHVPGERRVFARRRAVGAVAAGLRHAAVLGDAEDDDTGGSDGRSGGGEDGQEEEREQQERGFHGLIVYRRHRPGVNVRGRDSEAARRADFSQPGVSPPGRRHVVANSKPGCRPFGALQDG